jgi:hypothetical protein
LNRCHPQFFFTPDFFGPLFEAFSPAEASRGTKYLEIFGTLPSKAQKKFNSRLIAA